jgi:hypothetical protein
MISSRYYENAKDFAIVYTQLLKNIGNYSGDSICFSNNNYKHSVIFLNVNFDYGKDFILDYDIPDYCDYLNKVFAEYNYNFSDLFNDAALQCKQNGLIAD